MRPIFQKFGTLFRISDKLYNFRDVFWEMYVQHDDTISLYNKAGNKPGDVICMCSPDASCDELQHNLIFAVLWLDSSWLYLSMIQVKPKVASQQDSHYTKKSC